jgi:hypothetical protein
MDPLLAGFLGGLLAILSFVVVIIIVIRLYSMAILNSLLTTAFNSLGKKTR